MPDNLTKAPTADDFADLKKQLAELAAELAKTKAGGVTTTAVPSAHDLDTFKDGEFEQRGTGEKFKLKVVEDDQYGKRFHLKNDTKSFFASNVAEFREAFDGNFARFEKKEQEAKELKK